MNRIEQLTTLHKLAGARRDADVAVLERLRVQLRAVEMQITMLEQAAVEDWSEESGEPSAYQYSGRDALWDAWRLGRIRELVGKSARIRADIEQQTVKARQSVGKNQVIGKIIERVDADAKRSQAW